MADESTTAPPPVPVPAPLTVADFRAAMQAEREEEEAVTAPLPEATLSAPIAANRFQAISRLPIDQVGPLASIPNYTRHLLKPTDLKKLHVNATPGLKDKFSLMSVSGSFLDGVELLKENVVATKLIEKVKEHCECYGMDEVFKIVVPPADGTLNIDATLTQDLFSNYSSLTRKNITSSILFYRHFGQSYDLENLSWSEQFLSNCCDAELGAKLDERMASYTERTQRGGPIFFFEMMEAIMTLTTEAATLMKDKLRTLRMQDFAGEDIHRAATVIKGTHKRLEMINDVPSDLPQWIINIFLTCSVPQFVHRFLLQFKVYIV